MDAAIESTAVKRSEANRWFVLVIVWIVRSYAGPRSSYTECKEVVAVTASEGTKTKGGIGIVAGIVSLGSSGPTDKTETAVSRLSCKVPLLLPLHGKKEPEGRLKPEVGCSQKMT